jgi:hypothetical protein
MHYDENGIQVYDCNICRDIGRVHPRRPDDGKPDYSKVVPCRCRKEAGHLEDKQGRLAE